jgi:hypothetical protein
MNTITLSATHSRYPVRRMTLTSAVTPGRSIALVWTANVEEGKATYSTTKLDASTSSDFTKQESSNNG